MIDGGQNLATVILPKRYCGEKQQNSNGNAEEACNAFSSADGSLPAEHLLSGNSAALSVHRYLMCCICIHKNPSQESLF